MVGAIRARLGLRTLGIILATFALCATLTGCGSSAPPPAPDVEGRIGKLFRLYQAYVQKNQKGPPSEEALREFGQKLTAKEREEFSIGEDLETIFTSPRDNKKFEVQYNIKIDPSQNRAVIWESTSQDGTRFVALSIGYIVQYADDQLKDYKK